MDKPLLPAQLEYIESHKITRLAEINKVFTQKAKGLKHFVVRRGGFYVTRRSLLSPKPIKTAKDLPSSDFKTLSCKTCSFKTNSKFVLIQHHNRRHG